MKSISKFYKIAKNTLYPINRSITGKGIQKTLKIIQKQFPNLQIKKIRSGTKCFDWRIPREWNIRDAYVKDNNKKKIINFKKNNLHILGYSKPIKKKISKKILLQHIYSLKKQPDAIPYITSYYNSRWGFCIKHKDKIKLIKNYKNNDQFEVLIDSKFNNKGHLTYGELILKGKTKQEILISTYICHPSMANNELSGPIVSMSLINYFQKLKLKKTLRFIFIPETIGSIAYLSKNLSRIKKFTIGGYNLTCIGDEKNHSCMMSKYGNSISDRSLIKAYKKLKINNYKIYSFLERGSDERQFNSPGVDIPFTSIFRSKYGTFKEYHTSLDNFSLVTKRGVYGGFKVAKEAIKELLNQDIPIYRVICEPQLGKRGLYPTISQKENYKISKKYTDFLQYSDGRNTLNDIANTIKIDRKEAGLIYNILKKKKLVF